MKKFIKNIFIFSVVIMGLNVDPQSYSAVETTIDSTISSDSQQTLDSSIETYDSTGQKEITTNEDDYSNSSSSPSESETTNSIQESQTTLWDS